MKGTCITLINQNKASCQLWVLSFYASNILKLRKWDIKRLKQRYGDKWNASAFASLHTPLYSYIITHFCIIFCIPDSYLPFLLISTNLTVICQFDLKYRNRFCEFCYIMMDRVDVNSYRLITPSSFFPNFIQPLLLHDLELLPWSINP